MVQIEVSCNTVNDCITAKKCGADRIQLSSGAMFGGLSPTLGTLISVKDKMDIPVMTVVRARFGGFNYTEEEFLSCCIDARMFCDYGADGIIFGFLTEEGDLDYEKCAKFLNYVKTDDIIFNRAIDIVNNPLETIEKLISLGVKRIMTSGARSNVLDGLETIKLMQSKFGNKIEFLPSGDFNSENINKFIEEAGVSQVHINQLSMYTANISGSDMNFGINQVIDFGSFNALDGVRLKKIISRVRNG